MTAIFNMYFFYHYILFCLTSSFLLTDASKENQCPEHQIKTKGVKIQSPLFPKYPLKFRCWYNISAPPDYMVVVNFTEFRLPERMSHEKANFGPIPEDCATDYLQMWNFDSVDKSNKFCGQELKGLTLASKETMSLLFQSFDADYVPPTWKPGFEATINFVPISEYSNCTNPFFDKEIEVEIPNWGTETCVINVKAPVGKVPILQLSKDSNEGNGVIQTFVTSHNNKNMPHSNNYTDVACEGDIRGKSYNSNFAQFYLHPKRGKTKCRVQVKFVDPYELCGGVKEILETSKHDIFDFDFVAPSLCIWKVVMKNTKSSLDVMATLPLNAPNDEGICEKDHVMGFVTENNKMTKALPATCGAIDGDFYIEVEKSETKRDVAVTVIVYAPYMFRNKQEALGNLQYYP